MRKLRIGYWPLSQKLNAPGDRRRVIFWAKARGHEVITDLSQSVDVVIASESSDFNSKVFAKIRSPLVFDLVDSYLSPLNSIDDYARGLAKKLSGQVSGGVRPFSHHVRDFCINSDAVICSSIEQENVIRAYQDKTHVILDSHGEIPTLQPRYLKSDAALSRDIFWEGQPATITGVNQISPILTNLVRAYGIDLNFVTDLTFFRYLNRYIKNDTHYLLESNFREIRQHLQFYDWSIENLVLFAQKSALAMIPLDLSIPMQKLKPENRLLIMWRLGLPCLTSPSSAYMRVAKQSETNVICNTLEDWQRNSDRLLSDPDFAKEEIVKGQSYLHQFHSDAVLLSKWDEAIESVMQ